MDFFIKIFSIDIFLCLFFIVFKIKNKYSVIKLIIDFFIKVCVKKKKEV